MYDHSTSTDSPAPFQQQTLDAARTVLCRGLRIRFPLPAARGVLRRLDGSAHRRLGTIRSMTEDALNSGEGVIDPISHKPIRIYRRTLNKGQVASLRRLAAYCQRHPGETWAHVADFNGRRDGDLAKLAMWGFVLRRAKIDCPKERPRGWWMLTQLGRDFLRGAVAVPRYHAVLFGRDLGPIDDADCLRVDQVADAIDHAHLAATGGVEMARVG